MIENIQVLRGLAALAVVFYHTKMQLPNGVHTEFSAVAVFFVISGFIMAYIPRKDPASFIYDRITRIVPLYWLVTLFFTVWEAAGPFNLPYTLLTLWTLPWPNNWNFISNQFVGALDFSRGVTILQSLLFVPMDPLRGPVVGVGWSLNLEMLYYSIFALCILINPRNAPIIAVAALVLFFAAGLMTSDGERGGHGHIHFAVGILLYFLYDICSRYDLSKFRWFAAPIFCLIIIEFIRARAFASFWLPFSLYLLPALLVLAILGLHLTNLRADWWPWTYLGTISYSLYITHLAVLETLWPIAQFVPLLDPSKSLFGLATAIGLSIILAAIVHHWVERPITTMLRGVAPPMKEGRRQVPESNSAKV